MSPWKSMLKLGKQVASWLETLLLSTKKNVPALYKEIKDVVVSQVTKMTDLEVVEVMWNVVDIKTKEQHEADSVRLKTE